VRGVDPVTVEVVRNAFVAYADEMATVLCRTAYNMMIFEVRDYCVGICDPNGAIIAQNTGGLPIFLADLGAAVKGAVDIYGLDGFAPGDVLLSNDPKVCGQHLNNVVVFTPFFHEGELVAFSALRAHWVDIGGGSRGFGSTASRDLFDEGLQVRAIKAWEAGKPNNEVLRLLRDNIRFPDSSFGDLRAQIAGCRLGERRMGQLYAKYGRKTVSSAISEFWNQSERLARSAVRAIPDGTYTAESYMDHDFLDRETAVPIRVKVIVAGDEMTVDFSGLPPQAKGPINAGASGGVAAARVAFKCLTSPNGVVNEGEMRPLKVILPPGTILSAEPPAPLAFWSSSLPTVIETILRALSDVVPDRIPAGHKGDMSGLALYGEDAERKRRFICLNIFGGGFGAKPHADGESGVVSICQGAVQNAPVEVQEAYYPLIIETHRLRPDSGGAGKHRGGLGVEIAISSDQDFFANTHLQRTKLAPWGLHGGKDGLPMDAVLVHRDGHETSAVGLDKQLVRPGEKLIVRGGGGGGFGSPLERPMELVHCDVTRGAVSPERARIDYGVEIDPGSGGLDREASLHRRERMSSVPESRDGNA
jgi:N-methylhydantoinase B